MSEVIDIHIHFGSPKDIESGCYWSKAFEKTPAYWFMKLTTGNLFKKMNHKSILKTLLKAINNSKRVDKCVILAMDKVFDENGFPQDKETHLYVPNSYIIKLSENNKKILFGASVHPFRKDWQNELEYCIKNGACLCKWIPSSQQIDPANEKCVPFYKFLAEHNLPLLIHSGPEYAIPTSNEEYIEKNNPKYVRTALDLGVTVIIAHCSLPYFGMFDTEYFDDVEEYFKLVKEAGEKNWKLYSDLSAITTPLRNSYIPEIRSRIPHETLLFGSDYPLPASELSYKKSKNLFKLLKLFFEALSIKNPLDKNYYLIDKMGFDSKIYNNAEKLFSQIIR